MSIDELYFNFLAWIAYYIATFEGFFQSGTVAARNNNPGNLRTWGSRPIRDGFAVFDTAQDGWHALLRQIDLNVRRNLTLLEFFSGKPGVYPGYAPAADKNNPYNYASFIGNRLNIPLNQPLPVIFGIIAQNYG